MLCTARQAGAQSLSSGDVVGKANGLQKDIDGVSVTANHLTVSFYALLAWMVLITSVLFAIVVLSVRRWRRQRRRAAELEADDGFQSTSDASSVRSRPPNENASAGADCHIRTVLEGVAIGRRASLQSNVDAAVDSLTTSAAEP